MKDKFVRNGMLAIVLLSALFLSTPKPAHAATITSTTTGGDWNATTTWSGGAVPVAGDDVVIATTGVYSVTLNISPGISMASLTVNSGAILTFGGNNTSGRTLIVSGAVTNNGTMQPNNPGSTANDSLQVGGDFTNNGIFTSVNGFGNIAVTLNGTGAQSIGGSSTTTFQDLNLSNTVATIGATTNFNVNGIMRVNAVFSPDAVVVINSGGAAGTINGSGTIQVTRIAATADYSNQYRFATNTLSSMTVDYAGTGNQNINSFTYGSLRTSGSGTTKTVTDAGFTVNNNITIGSGTTLDVAGYILTLLGGATLVVNGTLDFTDSNGLIRTGISGTTTLTMAANGLIRTVDETGLGPGPNTAPLPSLVTRTGGTWNTTSLDTNGTVEYYRSSTSGQTVTDRDYNNLTIAITGTTQIKTWAVVATRTVNGNLTIKSGAQLTMSGAQTVNVLGNWSNSGTFTAGTGTIGFTGTSAQTIGGSATTIFSNLTINNTFGTQPGVTLNTDATVTGTLTLSSDLATGTNTLTMGGASATTTGGYDVVGTVSRTGPGTGAQTYGSQYTSLNFASPAPAGTVSVTLQKSVSGFDQSYVNRQYSITVPSGTADLRLHYQCGDLAGSPTETNMALWRYSGGRWVLQGRDAGSVRQCPGGNAGYVQKNSVSAFSNWAITDNGSPNAVTLSSFNGRGSTEGVSARVTLAWTTGSETNTAGFNIYRSEHAEGPYTRINTQLIPTNADPLLGGKYQYEDTSAVSGQTYYYQLEDVELNGTSLRHTPIAVTVAREAEANANAWLGLGLALAGLVLIGSGAYVIRKRIA